jgi:hypothetical protein
MKKFWIAFVMALLALAFVAAPALASEPPQGGASADVDCDEPGVDNENPNVGDTVLFYGTVWYDISAYNNQNYWDGFDPWTWRFYQTGAYVKLDASGYYFVLDPNSNLVADDGFYWSTGYYTGDTGTWYGWPWDEDVSYSIYGYWPWEAPVFIDTAGDYTVEHGGDASAEYGEWVQWYRWVPGEYCGGYWVPDGDPIYYAEGDPAYDRCFAQRTVTAHSNAALATARIRPILTILTSEDSELYFTSDGWGDPTTDDIVYNDGTWQVEVADGTKIQLDGEWHRKTWIEVDDHGNAIFKYGSDGHIIATEIGLSSPITVTKVG